MGNVALAGVLTQQENLSRSVAAALTTLSPPLVGMLPTLQMKCVLEDLALFGDQLARLLHDVGAALGIPPPPAAPAEVPVENVGYPARARAALSLVRRAEGWLETVDHQTGARVTLPGLEPGAPALEQQLGLL
jgi:hypothetical protein